MDVIQSVVGNRRIIVLSRSDRQYEGRKTAGKVCGWPITHINYTQRHITKKGSPSRTSLYGLPKRMTDFLKMEGVIVGMQGPVELDVPLVRFAGQASGQ